MEAKYTINNLEDEVKQLKRLLFRLKTEQLQQVEALKIKMAVMHENDIKALVSLYETKIEGVGRQVKTKDEEL